MAIPQYKDVVSIGNRPTTLAWQETSGVARAQRSENAGHLWMVSDGSELVIHTLRTSDNTPRGEFTLVGASMTDKEDVASATVNGQPYIYIPDFGDNNNNRATFLIHRVKEPVIGAANVNLAVNTDYETITCQYPSAPTHKDAETLIVDPATGDMYVILKRVSPAPIYKLAHAAWGGYVGTQTLTLAGTIPDTPSIKTWGGDDQNLAIGSGNGGYFVGGDINSDGTLIVLKSYTTMYIWERNPATQTIIQALQTTPTTLEQYGGGFMNSSIGPMAGAGGFPPLMEPKGEGVCFDAFDNIYTASEYVSTQGSSASNYPTLFMEKLSLPISTVTLQQGLSSYAGAVDTYVSSRTSPDERAIDQGAATSLIADYDSGGLGGVERRGLLKFDLSSIPAGSTIVGADLWLYVNTEGLGFAINKMYTTWTASSTYTGMGHHMAYNDVEAASVADAQHNNYDTRVGYTKSKIPLSTIQNWVNGSVTNNGWIIRGTDLSVAGDGQQFDSSEGATQAQRPKLVIRYVTPLNSTTEVEDAVPTVLATTVYPTANSIRTDQREPIAYITGGLGVVRNTTRLSTDRRGVRPKITGAIVTNSTEAGHVNAKAGTFPGTVDEKYTNGLSNRGGRATNRFVIDADRASQHIGWSYNSKQQHNTFYYFTLGSDLITNGGMASNLTGWTLSGNAIWSDVYSGSALLPDSGVISQAVTVVANTTYKLSVDLYSTGDIDFYALTSGYVEIESEGHQTASAPETHSMIFDSGANTSIIIYLRGSAGGPNYIKNVSLYKVQKDIQSTFGSEVRGATFLSGKRTTNKHL